MNRERNASWDDPDFFWNRFKPIRFSKIEVEALKKADINGKSVWKNILWLQGAAKES